MLHITVKCKKIDYLLKYAELSSSFNCNYLGDIWWICDTDRSLNFVRYKPVWDLPRHHDKWSKLTLRQLRQQIVMNQNPLLPTYN